MSDDLEELRLDDLDVDASGKVVKRETTLEPRDKPREIKGSASLIKDYQACPAKAFGRITRQPQKKTVALILGIGVHAGLEKFAKYQEDAQETFLKELAYEAERNEIALNTKDGEEAKKVGTKCVASGTAILSYTGKSGIPLYKRLDPEYIERYFCIVRNGRKFTGKIDYAAPIGEWRSYVVGDWKTGKNAPGDYELQEDIQFSMYPWALANDPNSPRTFGIWPERSVYMHLRGQSTEFHPSGKRKSANESKNPLKYDFPTKRTPEQVEAHFKTRIDPVMAAMEANVWFRGDPKNCSWCGFFDKDKQRCTVELPGDAINLDNYVDLTNGDPAAVKPLPGGESARGLKDTAETMLFDQSVVTDSRRAGLKPYSAE